MQIWDECENAHGNDLVEGRWLEGNVKMNN